MIKTHDVIIEPHRFYGMRIGDTADDIMLKVFFEAIKEANQLGVDGYRVVNFRLVDLGRHSPVFHRQFIIEYEEVEPEKEKDVTPKQSKYLPGRSPHPA